jgi:hypothetical protein
MEQFQEVQPSYFAAPLTRQEATQKRQEFIDLLVDYRSHFPFEYQPGMHVSEPESKTADEFHGQRLTAWREKAVATNHKLMDQQQPGLLTDDRIMLYEQAEELVIEGFKNKQMLWGNGFVWPQNTHKTLDGKFYLSNFAHAKYYPEGYEFIMPVWQDVIAKVNAASTAKQVMEHINIWLQDLLPHAASFKITAVDAIVRPALVERLLGTIYADTIASIPFDQLTGAVKVEAYYQAEHKVAVLTEVLQQMLESEDSFKG